MNGIERLAVEQAVYNAIGADLKTGVPDNLRGEVNGFYLDLYKQTGATAFEVRLNGQKVGTYGFAKTKERTEPVVVDAAALLADDDPDFERWCEQYVVRNVVRLAEQYAKETGELLDGMEAVSVPAGIKPGGTLRVRPEKVAAALGNALPATIAGLLEGGDAS